MTILHSLNRLRLRLGLFFWWNHAWVMPSNGSAGDGFEVHWWHPRALTMYADSNHAYLTDAIAHIRRCVRSGRHLAR
jgi:hypothetical protein